MARRFVAFQMGTLNTRVGVTREPERGAPEMGAWALSAIAASSLNFFVSLSTSSPSAPSLRSESTCETPRPSDSLVLPSGHHSKGGPSVSIFPCRGVTQVLWVPRSRDPLRLQRVSPDRHPAPRLRPRHLLFHCLRPQRVSGRAPSSSRLQWASGLPHRLAHLRGVRPSAAA